MIRAFLFPALALLAAPLAAQDFSENSEARSWNLYAEEPALFEAKVVDAMCELTGDCPSNCGDGDRQLALLRAADGVLVMALKNNQPAFTGAVVDLLPYCGQDITVDGLMINDEDFPINNVYLVQRIKAGSADWTKASQWTKVWAANNPDAKGKGQWFRRDPRIQALIAKEGYLGLGLEIDKAFKEYLFE
ncbi:hypothetical protein [Sulfitobacter aestuariivivens]|uniref:Uncharacterized protein n=1 Tax=Sulfitobacter aestuariivivens TaxID=2766981 RepID=A0A927D6C3_9RHOB|nr:hypothetical protein [Sulfitobacter aestuariivivens]MBD3664307.1 hypothetical protein [Sulfitobacter aestuariivivens]